MNGQKQSRYNEISESLQILQKSILDLELTVDAAAGPLTTLRSENIATPKTAPDPQNVAFLISTMPIVMRQYAEKIQSIAVRLKDAFV